MPRAGTRCTVAVLLEVLEPGDAATLRDLVRQPKTSTRLAETLREMGHDVSSSTLHRHGRGHCKCPR